MFEYCIWSFSWSRILSSDDNKCEYISVGLAPGCIGAERLMYGDTDSRIVTREWARIENINIGRYHTTRNEGNTLIVDHLPGHVLSRMHRFLKPEIVTRLMEEDFLSQIDWSLYTRNSNGGAPFDKIRRKET